MQKRTFVKDLTYDPPNEVMQLFHYCEERRGFLSTGIYWSELLTDFPEVAGMATGLFDNECCWRAEWSLPIMEVLDSLRYNSRTRMAGGLNSREYVNTHDLSPSTVTWVQMKPTGSAS